MRKTRRASITLSSSCTDATSFPKSVKAWRSILYDRTASAKLDSSGVAFHAYQRPASRFGLLSGRRPQFFRVHHHTWHHCADACSSLWSRTHVCDPEQEETQGQGEV